MFGVVPVVVFFVVVVDLVVTRVVRVTTEAVVVDELLVGVDTVPLLSVLLPVLLVTLLGCVLAVLSLGRGVVVSPGIADRVVVVVTVPFPVLVAVLMMTTLLSDG